MVVGAEDYIRALKQASLLSQRGYKTFNTVCAFDIETTNLPDIKEAFMYHWQFGLADGIVCYGRTWREFMLFMVQLSQLKHKIVCYVHNLSFEYQFIKTILPLSDTMIIRGRKILRTRWRNIEFRCSYLLSNMSLRKYLEKWNVEAQKGELDYSILRYPWTELSPDELSYCINDVVGLAQAITAEMTYNGDDLRSIPLTSTGYVRREVRNAMKNVEWKHLCPKPAAVLELQEAFRGGNCHANRFRIGRVLENVQSADMSSAYPAVMCECEYPTSPFKEVDKIPQGKAWFARCRFTNATLRKYREPAPYLSVSMCRGLKGVAIYNGRVLGADEGEFTLTDVDWNIIKRQYKFETIEFFDIYATDYGPLPVPFIDTVLDFFCNKTELKGVDDYAYMKSKNLLNSTYGMSVQSPTRDEYFEDYPDENTVTIEKVQDIDVFEQIEDFFEKAAVLPYQWGVWVTAHCRSRLQQAIDLVGGDFVYCDTDSVKFTGKHDITALLVGRHYCAFNSKKEPAYLGVWDIEKTADRFCTLGAKKYCAEYGDTVKITVAGVDKNKGSELLKQHGGCDAFKPGFVFKGCGGMAAWYNDTKRGLVEFTGGRVMFSSNMYLETVDYTLSYAENLKKYLILAGII